VGVGEAKAIVSLKIPSHESIYVYLLRSSSSCFFFAILQFKFPSASNNNNIINATTKGLILLSSSNQRATSIACSANLHCNPFCVWNVLMDGQAAIGCHECLDLWSVVLSGLTVLLLADDLWDWTTTFITGYY